MNIAHHKTSCQSIRILAAGTAIGRVIRSSSKMRRPDGESVTFKV